MVLRSGCHCGIREVERPAAPFRPANERHSGPPLRSYILTLPAFQRSHVTTHATALLLHYCLATLRLRRVRWDCGHTNLASIALAERLGFGHEGVARWERVLPRGVEGERLAGWAEEQERGLGGHAVTLSVGWDDWRNGGKERVQGLLEREVRRREVAE